MNATVSSARIAADRFADAFRTASPTALASCFTPAGVLVHPLFGRVEGRDAIAAAEATLFGVFDEIAIEIVHVVDGGDWAAVSSVITARQCADLPLPDGTVLANLRTRVEIPACEIIHVAPDGSIIEAHRYHDTAAMFAALAAGHDLARPAKHPAATVTEPAGTAPDAAALVALVKHAFEHGQAALAEQYALDGVLVHPIAGTLVGRDQIGQAEGMLAACFADIEFHVERVIQDGWWGAAEITVSATHSAPLPLPTGTLPATGRRVTDHIVQVFRLAPDGRIAYAERTFDTGHLINQLTN